jgi:hypothetical protein
MPNLIKGTFHFHSTYSHDGKNSLREIADSLMAQGFSFCLMTEHFEDFDAAKFDRYVAEANEVSKATGFILIPGVEVDITGLHTIVFPARSFEEVATRDWTAENSQWPIFKVLAHPSKYPFELLRTHLEKYNVDAIELWNQQADSRYMPPLTFLAELKGQVRRHGIRGFFGTDLHSTRLSVANAISFNSEGPLTAESILSALMQGDFTATNLPTGIEFKNGSAGTDLDTWIQSVTTRPYNSAKLRMRARRGLRWLYKLLPREAQHSLNDFKNFVRNKV